MRRVCDKVLIKELRYRLEKIRRLVINYQIYGEKETIIAIKEMFDEIKSRKMIT
jgi:hypothetical protein